MRSSSSNSSSTLWDSEAWHVTLFTPLSLNRSCTSQLQKQATVSAHVQGILVSLHAVHVHWHAAHKHAQACVSLPPAPALCRHPATMAHIWQMRLHRCTHPPSWISAHKSWWKTGTTCAARCATQCKQHSHTRDGAVHGSGLRLGSCRTAEAGSWAC